MRCEGDLEKSTMLRASNAFIHPPKSRKCDAKFTHLASYASESFCERRQNVIKGKESKSPNLVSLGNLSSDAGDIACSGSPDKSSKNSPDAVSSTVFLTSTFAREDRLSLAHLFVIFVAGRSLDDSGVFHNGIKIHVASGRHRRSWRKRDCCAINRIGARCPPLSFLGGLVIAEAEN